MFPTVSHFIAYLFGINIPLPFNTFGVFVALAFISAYWAFSKELVRKEKLGILLPQQKMVTVGLPAKPIELVYNGLFGFIIGYKLVYAILNYNTLITDAQSVLISTKGNFIGGIGLAFLFVYWEYKEKDKHKLATPKQVQVLEHPYQLMNTFVAAAAVWGLLGAKVFDNLEHWDTFVQHPIDSLLSFSGLTFYGGLIVGGAAILYIAKKNGIKPLHMLDVGAPGMMLAYAVGRVGCHLAGDGDWGIVNLHPKPFAWLPDWLWSYTYPNNVVNEGIAMVNCAGKFCHQLPQGVYPTPIYEVIMASLLFVVLWRIRTKITTPGVLFGIYLIVNGVERFLIELIRVNSKYTVAGISFTQAELIAILLILIGSGLIIKLKKGSPE